LAREASAMLRDAANSLLLLEEIIAREGIECFYERKGRFVGAYTPRHYDDLARQLDALNRDTDGEAYMLAKPRQHDEIASDFYCGGMVVRRSGKLHPALYCKGLLDACRRHGVTLCAGTRATEITRQPKGFLLRTDRGEVTTREVVIATNGHTGDVTPALKRRVLPVASHIIATEDLDHRGFCPSWADTIACAIGWIAGWHERRVSTFLFSELDRSGAKAAKDATKRARHWQFRNSRVSAPHNGFCALSLRVGDRRRVKP
jgi:glycine/D-amino acid oxidase-like deaminating enzyme